MSLSSKKPYRVYRQRRRIRGAGDGQIPWGDEDPQSSKGTRAPRLLLRYLRRALFLVLVLVFAWSAIAFLSFRSAVKERNDALPPGVRAALAPTSGPAFATDHVTMLVGSDASTHRKRVGEVDASNARADTLILMRVSVPSRTVSMLSIPRDLHVDIPGYGKERINAAYANGGLPLAIRTVRRVTGVDVHHVAQIDFDGFREVVDALGGIEIVNPHLVESGAEGFDGRKWRFPNGKQTLNGRDALAYSRIRKVSDRTLRLNQAEATDLGRARRQQRVIDAIISEVVSADSVKHPRGIPRAVAKPLITDMSASQMVTFAFGKWWSKGSNNLRCRLGGDSETTSDGESVITPAPENRAVVRMWLGKQAPLPPANSLAPGCVRESSTS